MKKKLMMVAVLLGALSLGACVDDNESASVTDLREAKAEQLRSIAALNNAQAATEEALRESTAAIEAAKARQEQAAADKAEAEARIKAIEAQLAESVADAQLQASLAEWQAKLAWAQADLENAQGQIEKNALKLQKQLADLKNQMLDAQKDLADKEDALADEALEDLKTLANTYGNALIVYTNQSQAIAAKEASLAKQKADLADWEVLKASEIAAKEFEIEVNKKQIEALQKYTNYTEDVETLKLQLEDARLAWDLAEDNYNNLKNIYNNLDVADLKKAQGVDDLKKAIVDNDLYKNIQTVSGGYSVWVNGVEFTDYVPYKTLQWKGFQIQSEDKAYTHRVTDTDSLLLELEYKDVRALKVEVDAAIAAQNVKALTDDVTAKTTAYNNYVTATATAKAAYDAAPTDATAKSNYENALSNEENALNAKKSAEASLEAANEAVQDLNDAYALVSNQDLGKALTDAVKKYNDAIVAVYTEKAEAQFAMDAANADFTDKGTAYSTLYAVVNGTTTGSTNSISLWDLYVNWTDPGYDSNVSINSTGSWYNTSDANFQSVLLNTYIEYYTAATSDMMGAATIDDEIKRLTEVNETLAEEIEDLKDVTSQEELIADTEAELAKLNAVINALKIKVDALKARLDEKMSAYVDEDTPAEEQPAA